MKTVLRLLLFVVIFSAYCVEAMKFKQNIVKNKKFLQTSSTKVPLFNVNKPQGWQKNRAPYSSIKSPSNLSFSQKKEYFQNLIKNKKSSLWLSQKPLPFEYQQKNVPTHITLDEKDPKLSEKILDIIKKLKVLIKKKSRNKRNDEEKKSEFDWTWLASGFTVVGLIGLNEYLDYLNKKKAREGYISHEPFNAVEGPALYPKEFYKYALDGEMAATMDPDSFIEELHNVGLTAEDPPKIQCQIQRENQLEELARIVNFTEEEKLLFQAILNLPRQLFKGQIMSI